MSVLRPLLWLLLLTAMLLGGWGIWAQPEATAIVAPAPTPLAGPAPAPPVVATMVRWMGHWQDEDRREDLVHEVARDFAFTHPGIQVDLRFQAELMGERSKRRTAAFIAEQVRKPVPDWEIVWFDDDITQEVAELLGDPNWEAGNLVDFSGLPGFAAAHKPFITADPFYRASFGGLLPGPFIEGQYMTLWVNTVVAQRLGLAVRERGMTWDDLLGYAQRVQHARTAGDPTYLLYEAGDWLTTGFLFQALVRSRFPDLAQAVAKDGGPAKQGALRAAFAEFAALGRCDPLLPGHRERVWHATRDLPLRDACLFYVAGTWMYSHWRGIDALAMERMHPCELPTPVAVDHALGGYIPSWAVLAKAPGREAAVQLLMHWCSPDVANRWTAYTKNPTGLRGDLERLRAAQDPFERFMLDMDAKYEERVRMSSDPAFVLGPGGAVLGRALDEALCTLLEGHGDPTVLADDLLRRAGEIR